MNITTKEAVQTLTAALKSDPSLYIAYQANIAMAVYDLYEQKYGGFNDQRPTLPEMHELVNKGAKRFLDLLCEDRPTDSITSGTDLIAIERREQIVKHGFDVGDNDYKNGELKKAALFCLAPYMFEWPWAETHFQSKIALKTDAEQLAVAGAFCAAEIDRIQRNDANDRATTIENLYIELPQTLEQAVDYLMPRFKGMEKFAKDGENHFTAFCHSQLSGGIGMKIRNELKLWVHESPLHQYFLTNHNLFHADDMSGLILSHIYHKMTPKDGTAS